MSGPVTCVYIQVLDLKFLTAKAMTLRKSQPKINSTFSFSWNVIMGLLEEAVALLGFICIIVFIDK